MKVRVGDIFAIPLGDGRFALGQVLAQRDPILYLGAFSGTVSDLASIRPAEVAQRELALAGNFFATLFERGDWPVLGNAPVRPGIPFPCYKVRITGKDYVESWDGRTRREAKPDEVESLENRTDRAPVILANALKAMHGLRDWAERYDKLQITVLERSARILSSID